MDSWDRHAWAELRSDAEDLVNELPLRDGIALSDPADLTFADCMHRLVTIDRSAGALRRPESEARRNPLFYESMVLLDDVVQVRRCSTTTAPAEFPRRLQVGNGRWICRVAIDVNDSRRRSAGEQCEPQEQLCRD